MAKSKEMFMELREESTAVQNGISFEHLIDAKKVNLKRAIDTITNEVSEGNYDSLKGLILALKGKVFFTDLEKSLRPLAENDYLNRIEKGYSVHDTEVDQAATKTDYDYHICGDPVYERLVLQADKAKSDLDARTSLLKTLTKPMEMIDEETGESFRCLPPNKLQKQGLKITLR